jgi:glycosyltransferase involved in cell wall biosynthesis
MRKWAYMGIPHTGGTYSVFKNLREGLLPHGVELRWVAHGAECSRRLADGTFDAELQFGTVVAPEESEDNKQGAALVEFFERGDYEGVFVNALCGRVATNFVRYLDSSFPRIMIVHNITVATYAAARAVRDYVHATAGVSSRIAADLTEHKGFDRRWTVSIPNAIQMENFKITRRPDSCSLVRVLFLGRVEDRAKGCLLLPKVISHVQGSGVEVQWKIAGDGPDLPELKRRCNGFSNVKFLGRIPHEHVPQVLAEADIYIFPSRYEGFGISLVEAMAAGCVPVASAIRGVTDSIVEHGKTGYLFPIGDWRQAAEHVIQLAEEPAKLKEISTAAAESVQSRFSIETVAERYAGLMDKVLADPRPLKAALDIQRWRYPRGLQPGLRTFLPEGIKTRLRVFRESIM